VERGGSSWSFFPRKEGKISQPSPGEGRIKNGITGGGRRDPYTSFPKRREKRRLISYRKKGNRREAEEREQRTLPKEKRSRTHLPTPSEGGKKKSLREKRGKPTGLSSPLEKRRRRDPPPLFS